MPSLTGGYSANEAREITRRLIEMQNNMNGGGSLGSGAGQNSQSTSQSESQSGSYFSNPNLVGNVGGGLGRTIAEQAQGYSQFVDDPTSHPAYQNALSGMLAALVPGEQEGRRDLADMFRAAGNTASSSFGEAANKYQQGVDRNRMSVASDLLAKLYPQIAGAKFAPLSQASSLIDALKLEQSRSRSQSQSTSQPGGGAAPGGLASGPQGAQLAAMAPPPQLPPFNWGGGGNVFQQQPASPGPIFSSPGGPKYGAGF